MITESSEPPTALLLCGGGSRGAVEIGFTKALLEGGVSIDAIFGSSIGAINGAFLAAGWTPEELGALWSRFERKKLFRFNRRLFWQGLNTQSLYQADQLIGVLESTLPVKRFEELRIPLVVTATNLQTGQPVYLDKGELLPALLASIALPPYLPPVEHQGMHLIDGGIVANVPIAEAVARGAQRIFALLCHCSQELVRLPRGFLDIEGRALRLAIEHQMRHDLEHYKDQIEIVVLEPCFNFPPSVLRIEQVHSLIEQGYEFAKRELTSGHAHAPIGSAASKG